MAMDGQFSRRGFLQAGAAAGTALAAGSALGQGKSERVRIGFVGVGRRGTSLLHAMLMLPYVDVPAVCDIDESHAAQGADIVEKARGTRPALYTKGDRHYEEMVTRDNLDAVLCATDWKWHTPVMVAAMRAGKYGATEVPAAETIEECWELVRTSEETGMPCMMLENVCYFQNVLTLLRMVREGAFGELLHAEAGYQHDCRFLSFTDKGELTWRGQRCATLNGNLYPTHPIGPIAQWFNINRGDRFTKIVSMSTRALGMKGYAAEKFGADHPLASRDYAIGDVNTSLLETANGLTVTLYYDTVSPRPYDLVLRLQGTKGLHMHDQIYLHGVTPTPEKYEPSGPYNDTFAHPLWTELAEEAAKHGGHGGSDYITVYEFVKAVRNRSQTPQDVYDAATWSAIVPLSIESVAKGAETLEFPDFTQGRWRTNAPLPVYGA